MAGKWERVWDDFSRPLNADCCQYVPEFCEKQSGTLGKKDSLAAAEFHGHSSFHVLHETLSSLRIGQVERLHSFTGMVWQEGEARWRREGLLRASNDSTASRGRPKVRDSRGSFLLSLPTQGASPLARERCPQGAVHTDDLTFLGNWIGSDRCGDEGQTERKKR